MTGMALAHCILGKFLGVGLIAHTAKIIAKILRRRIETKIENVLGEDQFEFRRGKELGMQSG